MKRLFNYIYNIFYLPIEMLAHTWMIGLTMRDTLQLRSPSLYFIHVFCAFGLKPYCFGVFRC